MKNNLFIISGPSGAGEDSIINGLKKKFAIEIITTTTTRDIRTGEINGNDYYFISEEKFKQNIKDNKYFEWAKQYNNKLYGVTFDEIERVKSSNKVGIWKIEYKGVIAAKKLLPEITAIFINAPLGQLAERLKKRDNASDEFIAERLSYTKEWLKHTDIYDYEILNKDGKLNASIEKVYKIIKNKLQ